MKKRITIIGSLLFLLLLFLLGSCKYDHSVLDGKLIIKKTIEGIEPGEYSASLLVYFDTERDMSMIISLNDDSDRDIIFTVPYDDSITFAKIPQLSARLSGSSLFVGEDEVLMISGNYQARIRIRLEDNKKKNGVLLNSTTIIEAMVFKKNIDGSLDCVAIFDGHEVL